MKHLPTAVLCTPLDVEHRAALDLLDGHRITEHLEGGTVYEVTEFEGRHTAWRLVLTLTSRRNEDTAAAVEHAIAVWDPQILLLAGIAGGLRDSSIGDVIAATKVYGYESGQDTDGGFEPRVDTIRCSHMLIQQAHRVAEDRTWTGRLDPDQRRPRVFHRPIAAGGKVVTGTGSETAALIRRTFGDTQGIEMEGYGAMAAASRSSGVDAMVVRGVSDLIDDKTKSADRTRQPLAARNAAAFALALIERCKPARQHRAEDDQVIGGGNYTGAIGDGAVANTAAIGPGASGHLTINQHGR
ncbi:hypothetical protein L0U85_01130 [Glycomyces sp. L485]|uniref:5'-methylthioadenosine/S-adenosylhomocysteine nucleosidase family protein n=1 Tax=Glycomyces sp. L485 TaxID=2909235 RepID=UPI001F4A6D4B|nr:hypothetical protein [Glycomyces sp. L485]MCH7229471.1 hypothetical protein [Glycomyces sp. L485]